MIDQLALEELVRSLPLVTRVNEAQHVINLAAEDGHFEQFFNEKNCRTTWARVKDAALELLAGEYPDLDVRIVATPDSQDVQIKVIVRRP